MRRIRRNDDLHPRLELYPMIDVIFLLLTFFVYCMVMMVRAEVLPVQLTKLSEGQRSADADIVAITMDRGGALFLNRRPASNEEIDAELRRIGKLAKPPAVYLAMEAEGSTDRGPLLLSMIERVRAAGVTNFVLVGAPGDPKK